MLVGSVGGASTPFDGCLQGVGIGFVGLIEEHGAILIVIAEAAVELDDGEEGELDESAVSQSVVLYEGDSEVIVRRNILEGETVVLHIPAVDDDLSAVVVLAHCQGDVLVEIAFRHSDEIGAGQPVVGCLASSYHQLCLYGRNPYKHQERGDYLLLHAVILCKNTK